MDCVNMFLRRSQAGGDTQAQATPGQNIDFGRLFGHQHGLPRWQNHKSGHQFYFSIGSLNPRAGEAHCEKIRSKIAGSAA